MSHTTVNIATEFYVNGLLKLWDGNFLFKNGIIIRATVKQRLILQGQYYQVSQHPQAGHPYDHNPK